jgi:phenylalanyl-tRNA synthetase beta chain
VVIQTLSEGTPFVTLDGTERKLKASDLVICNDNEPMCLAGVFGGKESGVSDVTVDIFLESAYFNPDVVRKTSQVHALKTDSSFRFERGTDPNMPLFALMCILKKYKTLK